MSEVKNEKGMVSNGASSVPLLLDLFCGIGGSSVGYQRAGFDIIGVDHVAQPQYPFPFFRMDALKFGVPEKINGRKVVAVHASPPCQKFVALGKGMGHWKGFDHHPDLLEKTRDMFNELDLTGRGVIWIIENVEGAPMNDAITLCGSMFNLKITRGYLQRHRKFESNLFELTGTPLMVPGPCNHDIAPRAIGVYGNGRGGSGLRERTANAQEARELMGIDWASRNGITQAIPPAYTEYLGKQILGVVNGL